MATSQKLPKSCYGDYAGEMEGYVVLKDDMEIQIDPHDIKISISGEEIVYYSGSITVRGQYEFIKQSGSEYIIKATFSNGKSLTYEMEFLWNKKEETIMITGKNGEPDCMLEKLDD